MVTNNVIKSDLDKLYDIVQNTLILAPKELVIATLKEFFSKDTYYRYSTDLFGFSNTIDITDVDQEAGLNDNITTRLHIAEAFRYDITFYPAIIVRHGGSSSVPISFNREKSCVIWEKIEISDGYNSVFYNRPKAYLFAGAWNGTINIDIYTKSLRSRDDLADRVAILFTDIANDALIKSGVFVSKVSVSSPSEDMDRANRLFKQTVTLDIRSEWRREIPIANLVDSIMFSIDFGRLDVPDAPIAPNLSIKTELTLTEFLITLL